MRRVMLKSKIHKARVTDVNIDYDDSTTIDRKLMEQADILHYEQVEVLNINNGARFTTYVTEEERGEIYLSRAAARSAVKGDIVIILSYCYVAENEVGNFTPKLINAEDKSTALETKRAFQALTLLEAE